MSIPLTLLPFAGLVCYVTTKVMMYLFLVEKAVCAYQPFP